MYIVHVQVWILKVAIYVYTFLEVFWCHLLWWVCTPVGVACMLTLVFSLNSGTARRLRGRKKRREGKKKHVA